MTAGRRHRAGFGSLLVGSVLLAACSGVPVDEEPEAISRAELPAELLPSSTSTTLRSDEADTIGVYLVQTDGSGNEVLVSVPTEIPRPEDPADLPQSVMIHLVGTEPTVQHANAGYGSDIPRTVTLRSVTQDGTTVTVDLSGLETVEGIKQQIAVAQIVFTLTELEGIEKVRILSDGQARRLTTDVGSSEPGEALSPDEHFPTLKGQLSNAGVQATTTTVLVQPAVPSP